MEHPELNENQIIQLLGTASENLRETIEHLNNYSTTKITIDRDAISHEKTKLVSKKQ